MDIINILGWLVIGLVVGALARFLVPGRDPMGCLATSLLGIAGAFVGGFLAHVFLNKPWMPAFFHRTLVHGPYGNYARPGFLISLLGAMVVVIIVRMLRRPA